MITYNRAYCESKNDFALMWQFLIEHFEERKHRFVWPADRLGNWKHSIWHERKYVASFYRNNAQLWFNTFDELVGFVISERGESDFFILTKRNSHRLSHEMIQWVKENWQNRIGNLYTEVHEDDDLLISLLESKGLVRASENEITREYKLSDRQKREVCLEEGFTLTNMKEHPDFPGKRLLYYNAFRNQNKPLTNLDLIIDNYARENPWYQPEFDFSILNDAGQQVATCLAYIDYGNNVAIVEKVCTHSEYRKRGLAKAVIQACFKQLYEEGIEYAYIGAFSTEAKNLYGTLEPTKSVERYRYKLV